MVTLVASKAIDFEKDPFKELLILDELATTYSQQTAHGFVATSGNIEIHATGSSLGTPDAEIAKFVAKVGGEEAFRLSGLSIAYEGFRDGFGADPLQNVLGLHGDDSLTGSKFRDTLFGFEGDDTLRGRGGNDHLFGDAGRDTLTGGSGKDWLDGGFGRDVFDFNKASESKVSAADTIVGFNHAQRDHVDLRTIDADRHEAGDQAFHFIGGKSFREYHLSHPDVAGLLRYADGKLSGDVNGDLHADFVIKFSGEIPALVAHDFFL